MMQKRKNPTNNQTKTRNPEKKYVGVRQRPSGRWVAEIKDTIQKIRVWLGTYDTAEAAARAYDEAACILRGPHTRTNFWPPSDSPSALPPKISNQLLLMLKSKSATKAVNRGFRGSEIDSSVGQSPIFNSIDAPFSAPCSIIDFSSYLPDDGTKLECFEHNLYVPTMNSTSPPSYSGGGGDWTGSEEIDVRDFMFVDEMEGLFGGDFSAFEIAEEIATEEVEEEEPVMKRMKYERRVSASLYALNGVSECLKLKGELGGNALEELKRSCDRKMKVMLVDEEKLRPVEQLDDSSSSSSSPSLCSYSSSSFFGGDEDLMSLWTFLDLPPICGGER